MVRVTFSAYSDVLKKFFPVTEVANFKSIDDARLRACALGWQIAKVEEIGAQ